MSEPSRKNRPIQNHPRITLGLNVLLGISAALAVATLVMKYGGFDPDVIPLSRHGLDVLQRFIVGYFILDRLARLLLAKNRKDYFKANWVDYLLIVLFFQALWITYRYEHDVVGAGLLFVIVTQIYMLAMLVLRAAGANIRLAGSGLPPSWLLIGSFAALCLIGAGLLMLPVAVRPEYHGSWYFADSLFTAVSATCVTGLVVVDTGTYFTPFGQAVILAMIQLGGLGIMIFGTVLAMLAGKALTLRSSETLGEMIATDRLGELRGVIRFAVLITLTLEAVGALLLLRVFLSPDVRDAWGNAFTTPGAIWYSVFHSISAFCNAGFSLYDGNLAEGIRESWPVPLRSHWQTLGVMAPLIILGGLGFPVLLDCWRVIRTIPSRITRRFKQRNENSIPQSLPFVRFSLHSRIVIASSVLLIIIGAIGLGLLETHPDSTGKPNRFGPTVKDQDTTAYGDRWQKLTDGEKIQAALFQSVSARTAGFNTIDMDSLTDGSKFWLCVLMTIGGSPAGTAGGMKTVTITLMLLAAWSILRRRNQVEVFHRSISEVLLRRAVTIIILYLALLFLVTFLLCATMQNEKFIDLAFEASSACGTVGLSTGVTGRLELFGKCVIIAGMFVGRIGPLTLLLALMAGVKNVEYTYPQENVVIG